jgi:multicomponent Na+:H+ antiporter subunit C
MEFILTNVNYIGSGFLFCLGFFVVITSGNLLKKLIGLSILQVAVMLLFISLGKVSGAVAPILKDAQTLYSNPLPQVLILTAIVVGVSVLAVGLALAIRIKNEFGTVEEDKING